jgi:hypothetical protein
MKQVKGERPTGYCAHLDRANRSAIEVPEPLPHLPEQLEPLRGVGRR